MKCLKSATLDMKQEGGRRKERVCVEMSQEDAEALEILHHGPKGAAEGEKLLCPLVSPSPNILDWPSSAFRETEQESLLPSHQKPITCPE